MQREQPRLVSPWSQQASKNETERGRQLFWRKDTIVPDLPRLDDVVRPRWKLSKTHLFRRLRRLYSKSAKMELPRQIRQRKPQWTKTALSLRSQQPNWKRDELKQRGWHLRASTVYAEKTPRERRISPDGGLAVFDNPPIRCTARETVDWTNRV